MKENIFDAIIECVANASGKPLFPITCGKYHVNRTKEISKKTRGSRCGGIPSRKGTRAEVSSCPEMELCPSVGRSRRVLDTKDKK